MDAFDTAILNALRDGRPREFRHILASVSFSHNTLRLHLDSLADRNLVLREKLPVKRRGRPMYTYSVPAPTVRVPAMIPNPSTGVVSLSFSKLSTICRFEKGGFCKKARSPCNAQICPQIK